MSTRSNIAIQRKDGTKTGIYCHYDGYIEYVGAILYENYNTAEKVEELLALGNLSSLGTDIDSCFAYHRDGGEELCFSDDEQEFNYVFVEEKGIWYVTSISEDYTETLEEAYRWSVGFD